jgi:hypothetical protein
MTQENTPSPPPFIPGKTYEDEISEYKVLTVEGTRMTFERLDGSLGHTDNIALKATIHRRRVSEKQHSRPMNYQLHKTGSGTAEYRYEDVTPIVARLIEEHAKRSTDYLPHVSLVKELLSDSHARFIIDHLPATEKLKSAEAWAGVIIAGFSKEWSEGRWDRLERKKTGRGHAWRLKRR